jgi:hypothetical protein
MLAAQTIVPARALLVTRVYKPTAADSTLWRVEVENTSQSVITAYGLSLVCHYPDGTTINAGVTTIDLGPLLAGHAGLLAAVDYLRSAKPELRLSPKRGEDPSFSPGATRSDAISPPANSAGTPPDCVTAVPALVIMDDGRTAGDPNDVAGIFFGRHEDTMMRTMLLDHLRSVDASADPAGALDERLNAIASRSETPQAVAKLLPGQTRIFLDNPARRRGWLRDQLLLLKGRVGPSDHSGLVVTVRQYEAEAAAYERLAVYNAQ